MKKVILILLSVIFTFISCARRTTAGSSTSNTRNDSNTRISVLCYNIHHANPPSKPNVIDMNAVAEVITKNNPDVVALQEVDVRTTRSGTALNQAEELARLTGMKAYFAKAIDYGGGEYGVAILSKFPMENLRNIPLPIDEVIKGEQRTLALATLRLPGNKRIVFASTHLDAQRNDTNRQLQIKKILEVLKQEKLPVIIAGDLNAQPTSDIIKQLDMHFTRSCVNGCGFTIPVINPTKTIDFIAYAPASAFSVLSHAVIAEEYASDHRPVFATFSVK